MSHLVHNNKKNIHNNPRENIILKLKKVINIEKKTIF